ncbi:MAG: hypothetical protein ABI165_06820, partial [Bryobacteraceae bacterium]
MKSAIILLAFACAAAAQPGVSAPQIGRILDDAGAIRSVFGLPGSFVLGDASNAQRVRRAPPSKEGSIPRRTPFCASCLEAGVVSAAFSESTGILKTSTALLAVDAQNQVLASMDTPDGAALISTFNGPAALIYLPSSQTLYRWSGASFNQIAFDATQFSGDVISIAGTGGDTADFLVQRSDGLWRLSAALSTGAVISAEALPGVSAPA